MKHHGSLLIWLIIILASAAMYHAWGIIVDQQSEIQQLKQQVTAIKVNLHRPEMPDVYLGIDPVERKQPRVTKRGYQVTH